VKSGAGWLKAKRGGEGEGKIQISKSKIQRTFNDQNPRLAGQV
jgi:hypothetical protein